MPRRRDRQTAPVYKHLSNKGQVLTKGGEWDGERFATFACQRIGCFSRA